jgi:pimeloyl-ACP methyl ester carboxylesterase
MGGKLRRLGVVLGCSAAIVAVPGTAVAATPDIPGLINGLLEPGKLLDLGLLPPVPGDPPGANDWKCSPSAAHPAPVVLVHGTLLDMASSWVTLSQKLTKQGYCVFALNYGKRATRSMTQSGQELSQFVDRVLDATGAPKVSLVGHSQGGLLARYYVKLLGGQDKVDDVVSLSATNHGSIVAFANGADYVGCRSCVEQYTGSDFLAQVNAGDESPGAVSYTNLATRYDLIVSPTNSGFLAGGPEVFNAYVQDYCTYDPVDHLLMPYDPIAQAVTMDALAHPGPAAESFAPKCPAIGSLLDQLGIKNGPRH